MLEGIAYVSFFVTNLTPNKTVALQQHAPTAPSPTHVWHLISVPVQRTGLVKDAQVNTNYQTVIPTNFLFKASTECGSHSNWARHTAVQLVTTSTVSGNSLCCHFPTCDLPV